LAGNTVIRVPEVASAPTAVVPKGSTALRQLHKAATGLVPHAQYQLSRLGPAGVTGAAATLAAVILGSVALLSLRAANQDLNAEISRAQHRPRATVTPEQGLIKVVAQLPTRAAMPAILSQVLQQADAAGVELAKGQYTYNVASASGVARYELDFPVKAQYRGVRDFINRTLTNIPSAGLYKLSIERKAIGDTQVNADVRFVIFIRDRQP
jgi:hypothetical protein